MQTNKITDEVVAGIREWLGPTGKQFFSDLKREFGAEWHLAVLKDGPIPHPIHFREGMRVRNKLRELTSNGWTSHEYDDLWSQVIEQAIA